MGINIVGTYVADQPPPSDPERDPADAALQRGRGDLEDYLEDDKTYNVEVRWRDLDDDLLGLYTFDDPFFGGPEHKIFLDTKNPDGTFLDWFFDPTPRVHEEFDFSTNTDPMAFSGQTLVQNLTTTQRLDWYSGSPPQRLEVGYNGAAVDPAAMGRFDLLTVILHEIGHRINIRGGATFKTEHIGGASASVDSAPDGHIAPSVAPDVPERRRAAHVPCRRRRTS